MSRADIVIEAVFEDLALKQDVFRKIGEVSSFYCILVTNTSAISITTELAAVAKRS